MPTRKLLVTGANGFVAGSVLAQAGAAWEAHAVSRSPAPENLNKIEWHTLDITKPEAWETFFREIEPDVIIHTAAAADIDFCQANPSLARNLNVELTQRLVNSCKSSGARLV